MVSGLGLLVPDSWPPITEMLITDYWSIVWDLRSNSEFRAFGPIQSSKFKVSSSRFRNLIPVKCS